MFPVNTENVYRSCANLFHHASPTAEAKSRAPFTIRRFHNIHTILTITWYKSRHLLNRKFRNETWNLGDFQALLPVLKPGQCGAPLFRCYLAQKFATEETKEKTARYFRFKNKYITIHFNCVLFQHKIMFVSSHVLNVVEFIHKWIHNNITEYLHCRNVDDTPAKSSSEMWK